MFTGPLRIHIYEDERHHYGARNELILKHIFRDKFRNGSCLIWPCKICHLKR